MKWIASSSFDFAFQVSRMPLAFFLQFSSNRTFPLKKNFLVECTPKSTKYRLSYFTPYATKRPETPLYSFNYPQRKKNAFLHWPRLPRSPSIHVYIPDEHPYQGLQRFHAIRALCTHLPRSREVSFSQQKFAFQPITSRRVQWAVHEPAEDADPEIQPANTHFFRQEDISGVQPIPRYRPCVSRVQEMVPCWREGF
jgi:hypothetical protein